METDDLNLENAIELVPVVEIKEGLLGLVFPAMSLRDQLRQARLQGVSMETLPTPGSYDESEDAYDADADIRAGRFDRVEYAIMQHSKDSSKANPDVSKESSNAAMVSTPTQLVQNEAAPAADV